MFSSKQLFERRRARNRAALKRVSSGQPRLSVHRSSKHIYAQVIDDNSGQTLAAASTLEADLKGRAAPATAPPPRRSASLSPSVPRPRASRSWSSTVAATFITVG